jgi:hypothetical protein
MQPTISRELSALNDWLSLEKERGKIRKEKNRKGETDEERKE